MQSQTTNEPQKKVKKGKKVILGVTAIALVATSIIGMSFAFMSDKETVTNKFITAGDIDVEITEPNWNPNFGVSIIPGNVSYKDPTIKEIKGDAYMRIKMEITDKNGDALTGADGVTVAQQTEKIMSTLYYDSEYDAAADIKTPNINPSNQYSSTELAANGKITNLFDTTKYEKETTSSPTVTYFNYVANDKKFVEGTDTVLFTNVVIPSEWNQDDMKILDPTQKGYQIILTAEAVQYENVDSFEAAFADFTD